MGNTTFSVSIKTDKKGLVGRECPSCGSYFKLKFGTGIKTTQCICPYCNHKDDSNKFWTKDQAEYLKSVVAKRVVEPMLTDFANSINNIQSPSNGLIQIKISAEIPKFAIKEYQEKILETNILCDNCGLVFAIYGVFSNCPDCGKLNARVIYERSLGVSKKKLQLAKDIELDEHIKNDLIKDALVGSVSAFDSFGKALRVKYPSLPTRPKNLFQNFVELDRTLSTITGKNIGQFLTPDDSDFLFTMFQVRHIFEHNAGVIDNDFVTKLTVYSHMLGRKFDLKSDDIEKFIDLMLKLGDLIYKEFEN